MYNQYLTNVSLSYSSHEWKDTFVLGETLVRTCSSSSGKVKSKKSGFSPTLLLHGHSSAPPAHVVHDSFTTTGGGSARVSSLSLSYDLGGGDVVSWSQGCERLRSLLLGVDFVLLPSSAHPLLWIRFCSGPQEVCLL